MQVKSVKRALSRKEIEIAQPKCEQLSEENAQLKASLMAKRELQTQALQIADDLKRERKELLERTVSLSPHASIRFLHKRIVGNHP